MGLLDRIFGETEKRRSERQIARLNSDYEDLKLREEQQKLNKRINDLEKRNQDFLDVLDKERLELNAEQLLLNKRKEERRKKKK